MDHLTEQEMVLYYYGEAADGGRVRQHLEHCAECRAEYQELERILELTSEMPTPQRREAYGSEVWRELRPKLPPRRATWFGVPQWAWAAAAVLALAAFIGGRISGPTMTVVQVEPPAFADEVLRVAVGDHLERSERFLVEAVNSGYQEPAAAIDLLRANRLYRQSARLAGDPEMTRVLDDLERMLTEISHRPAEIPEVDLVDFRQRVDEGDLLFRVRVFGTHLAPRRLPVQEE